MSGKRNRAAGHAWERQLAEVFRQLGFTHVVTARSESRARDNQKVDLINEDERKNGRFVFNIQAKNSVGHLAYGKILSQMPNEPGVINVIAHKQTKRSNSRFVVTGKYAVMSLDDFYTLIKIATKEGILTPELVSIYDNDTASVETSSKGRIAKTILHGTGLTPWFGVQGAQGTPEA